MSGANMSDPVGEMLLLCAHVCLNASQAERLCHLATQRQDWERLERLAHAHGLAPLLYEHLHEVCPEAVPAPTLTALRDHARTVAAHNLVLSQELLRLLQQLEAQGIVAVPYKGPHLAVVAYDSLSRREFVDLDLLISPSDVEPACQQLLAAGYDYEEPAEATLSARQRTLFRRTQYAWGFVHAQSNIHLELHWRFVPPPYRFPVTLDALQARQTSMSLLGRSLPVLSPEDTLLALCVHGARHVWEKLKWVCDLSELIRRHPQMDWEYLWAFAEGCSATRRLELGLYLVQQCLEMPLPEATMQRLADHPNLSSLAQQVRRGWWECETPVPYYQRLLFYGRTLDKPLARIGCLCGTLASPKPEDIAGHPLASLLFPLYSTLRLTRKAWQRLHP